MLRDAEVWMALPTKTNFKIGTVYWGRSGPVNTLFSKISRP